MLPGSIYIPVLEYVLEYGVRTDSKGLNKMRGITATAEPHVGGDESQRRGDIRVTKGSTTYIVDVGMTCPATEKQVRQKKSHKIPGAAGRAYEQRKNISYNLLNLNNQPGQEVQFVPFIVETRGRINDKGRKFIDQIAGDDEEPANKGLGRLIYRTVADTIVRHQAYMMARLAKELRPSLRRAH